MMAPIQDKWKNCENGPIVLPSDFPRMFRSEKHTLHASARARPSTVGPWAPIALKAQPTTTRLRAASRAGGTAVFELSAMPATSVVSGSEARSVMTIETCIVPKQAFRSPNPRQFARAIKETSFKTGREVTPSKGAARKPNITRAPQKADTISCAIVSDSALTPPGPSSAFELWLQITEAAYHNTIKPPVTAFSCQLRLQDTSSPIRQTSPSASTSGAFDVAPALRLST
mmetsp:Transcript_57500/g.130273  ORF Transcript_57500/g.130273 Transcript_57500/m.130273 type:complete len:229 (-) Transcript_57500:188-874(-)